MFLAGETSFAEVKGEGVAEFNETKAMKIPYKYEKKPILDYDDAFHGYSKNASCPRW